MNEYCSDYFLKGLRLLVLLLNFKGTCPLPYSLPLDAVIPFIFIILLHKMMTAHRAFNSHLSNR